VNGRDPSSDGRDSVSENAAQLLFFLC
jgi:hypothetical protein